MINLMSYDAKKQTRAARMNVALFRYIVILAFSIIFLALACAATYYFLSNNKPKPAVKDNSYLLLQKKENTIRADLITAKNILDRQIVYSDVITGIAVALPTGTILDSLNLNDSSFGATTNLKIFARSVDIEPKIKENFTKSLLFSNYKLQSSGTNQNGSKEYPFMLDLTITINKALIQ